VNRIDYEKQVEEIVLQVPAGPRLAVLGSSSFWGKDSMKICEAVGTNIATIDDMLLFTGGVSGVGESVGRSFFVARQKLSRSPGVYHILPRGEIGWDYGETFFSGSNMIERREVLGRLARVFLTIEGGPGTEYEVKVAQSTGAFVIPLSRTGGFSENLYGRMTCPIPEIEMEWQVLDSSSAELEQVSRAVRTIVEVLLGQGV
jgi:hypothetical protein